MTAKTIFSKIKSKFVLLLALICVFTFSAFLFTACGDDETDDSETETTYTKQETDTADINNGSFEFGLADVDISDFPLSNSITGWSSVSTENSASSSKMISGVVDTSSSNYKKTLANMLDNSTFLTYAEETFGFKRATIVANKATENSDKTEAEIEELADLYIVETYLLPAYPNPGTRDGSTGSHVLMINNYTDEPWHTAQYLSSVSTIQLEKGTYGKISFYANASNLAGYGDYFLNLRIEGTLDSSTQAPYVLKGINNTNGWKKYTVYVKADTEISTSVTLSFALGYCNKEGLISNNVKGTAFIDDVVYEEISVAEFDEDFASNPLDVSVFTYNSEDVLSKNVGDKFDFVYSLVANEMNSYKNNVEATTLSASNDFSFTHEFLKSNAINGTTVDKFGSQNSKGTAELTDENKSISFTGLVNASYQAEVINENLFKVSNESYFYISFDIENKLNRLNSTDVSVYVIGDDGTEQLVGNYNTANETTRCHVLVKNNTPTTEPLAYENFKILIVVGPSVITTSNVQSDFATGSVKISNIGYHTGKLYQYEKDPSGNPIINSNGQKTELADYDFYSYLNVVGTSIALDDYYKEDADVYYLANSNSTQNSAFNKVASINGFTGVEPDHSYIKEDSTINAINDRIGSGNEKGVAGLINSKYLDNYSDFTPDEISGIKSALSYQKENSIQPIMVYNKTENSYGFLGTSFTVNSSDFAMISVKVRVTGNAKAFIYLVDTSMADKPVAELSFEKGNVVGDASYDKAFAQKLSFEGITADKMGSNGWLTLTFYVATGADAMNLRLELWNGSRDGATKSQGYVFFAFDAFTDSETFTPLTNSGAFNEPASADDAYNTKGNALYDNAFYKGIGRALVDNAIKYCRELDAVEIKFNSEDPETEVAYDPNYVWANALTTDGGVIYAIYNTIDPVAIDPYSDETTEEEEETGCLSTTDASTFWLSFSSILLGVVIVFALLALVVKHVRRRRIANKKDGVSHYKVTSRIKTAPKKPEKKVEKDVDYEDDIENYDASVNDVQETVEETTDEAEQVDTVEEASEDYVYGDVQDFGEDSDNKTE